MLFPVYHIPCSCNKLHTSPIAANQAFSAIFQTHLCKGVLQETGGSSTGSMTQRFGTKKPEISLIKFEVPRRVGSEALFHAWYIFWKNGELNMELNFKNERKSLPAHWKNVESLLAYFLSSTQYFFPLHSKPGFFLLIFFWQERCNHRN